MLLPIYLELAILAAILFLCLYFLLLAPPRLPANIPAIPFYVTLLPFFWDVDQEETYHRYLEKPLREHGAVKVFFGARWNILIARPEFMTQVFRDEDLFRKSGNHEKIPGSVFAEFLGENVISAHGDNWKLFRGVIKPGLLTNFGQAELERNTRRLVELIKQAANGKRGSIPVQELLQRFTIANTADSLFQTDFHSLDAEGGALSKLQTQVKREIFRPVFMNFPFLDDLPFPSRRYARQLVDSFSSSLQDGLAKRRVSDGNGTGSRLADLLVQARDLGIWTQRQFRDNLNVLFVASQENPQIALTSILYLLAKHPHVQDRLFAELRAADEHTSLESLPYLTATIFEGLRLYPPISQLINRFTTRDAVLTASDGRQVVIPRGTYVGYHAYAANRDPEIWGSDANEFKPERWGDDHGEMMRLYRQARARGGFITFHGGRRACLGERFAMLELRVAVSGLLRPLRMTLDSQRVRMMPAGPLYPRALRIVFTERDDGVA